MKSLSALKVKDGQLGFSLIEVLVAVAITGVIMMGITSAVRTMSRSNTFISAQQDHEQMNNRI